MTRWVLANWPDVDDEIDFICPPINWESDVFKLEHVLSGLEECLETIDKEKGCSLCGCRCGGVSRDP